MRSMRASATLRFTPILTSGTSPSQSQTSSPVLKVVSTSIALATSHPQPGPYGCASSLLQEHVLYPAAHEA